MLHSKRGTMMNLKHDSCMEKCHALPDVLEQFGELKETVGEMSHTVSKLNQTVDQLSRVVNQLRKGKVC